MIDRIALVTGATSGIGRAYAQALAKRGWAITAIARDEGRLRGLVSELPGSEHEYVTADLASLQGIATVEALLETDLRPVSLLVNAAGAGTSQPFPLAPIEEEHAMLRVNVEAVLLLSYAAAHAMKRRGFGAIINVSSTAAYWSAGTYAASKSWVLQMTLGLRSQVAESGIRVQAVVPGFTRTEFHARSSTDASGVRSWLWLQPEEVAEASIRALAKNQPICIPGWRYRGLVELVRHLPPEGRRAVLRRLAPLKSESRD